MPDLTAEDREALQEFFDKWIVLVRHGFKIGILTALELAREACAQKCLTGCDSDSVTSVDDGCHKSDAAAIRRMPIAELLKEKSS
jgi:hypothetical protein